MAFKSYFEAQVLGGLLELEEYLKTTEKYLLDVATDKGACLDEQANALPSEERNEFYERNIDFYRTYAETFPMILRNSFLVSAYSLLEHKMAFICKQLQKDKGLPISWKDLNGNTLEQFKKYCNLASLPFSFNNQAWQEIKRYAKVRNCIVHRNGLLSEFEDKEDLIPYLTRKGIISQHTIEQEIALTGEFCKEVVKAIGVFLNGVIEAHDFQSKSEKETNIKEV